MARDGDVTVGEFEEACEKFGGRAAKLVAGESRLQVKCYTHNGRVLASKPMPVMTSNDDVRRGHHDDEVLANVNAHFDTEEGSISHVPLGGPTDTMVIKSRDESRTRIAYEDGEPVSKDEPLPDKNTLLVMTENGKLRLDKEVGDE